MYTLHAISKCKSHYLYAYWRNHNGAFTITSLKAALKYRIGDNILWQCGGDLAWATGGEDAGTSWREQVAGEWRRIPDRCVRTLKWHSHVAVEAHMGSFRQLVPVSHVSRGKHVIHFLHGSIAISSNTHKCVNLPANRCILSTMPNHPTLPHVPCIFTLSKCTPLSVLPCTWGLCRREVVVTDRLPTDLLCVWPQQLLFLSWISWPTTDKNKQIQNEVYSS